jgi:hypothetical protein
MSKEKYVQPSQSASISVSISVSPSTIPPKPTPMPSSDALLNEVPAPIDADQFGEILDVLHIGLDDAQKNQLMAVMALQQMQAQQKKVALQQSMDNIKEHEKKMQQEQRASVDITDITGAVLAASHSNHKVPSPLPVKTQEEINKETAEAERRQAVIATQTSRQENMMKETLEDTLEWQKRNRASLLSKMFADKKREPQRLVAPKLIKKPAAPARDPRNMASYPELN